MRIRSIPLCGVSRQMVRWRDHGQDRASFQQDQTTSASVTRLTLHAYVANHSTRTLPSVSTTTTLCPFLRTAGRNSVRTSLRARYKFVEKNFVLPLYLRFQRCMHARSIDFKQTNRQASTHSCTHVQASTHSCTHVHACAGRHMCLSASPKPAQ